MFERPILIFSEFCDYSVQFFNILKEHEQIFKHFEFLNLDPDTETGQRPQLFYVI